MATRRTTDPQRSIPTLQPDVPTDPNAPRKRSAKGVAPVSAPAAEASNVEISHDARRGMIAEAAYLRAERRGFTPGYELDDWIAAESEVDSLLESEHSHRQ